MTAAQTTPTKPRLEEVLGDLTIEGDMLEAMVAPLEDARWCLETPAAGWTVAHQIAHLAWTDEAAVLAATDKAAWDEVVLAAMRDPEGFVDTAANQGATARPGELLDRWRRSRAALSDELTSLPDGQKLPWFGPPMSPTSMATARFMETWAHALDVADALGESVSASNRLRHLVHLGVRTRNFAFSVHGLEPPQGEFRIELVAPDGGERWVYGPAEASQSVRGSAYHFCLLVTQRRPRSELDLIAEGRDAERWLDIAQAFAGPPGDRGDREPQE